MTTPPQPPALQPPAPPPLQPLPPTPDKMNYYSPNSNRMEGSPHHRGINTGSLPRRNNKNMMYISSSTPTSNMVSPNDSPQNGPQHPFGNNIPPITMPVTSTPTLTTTTNTMNERERERERLRQHQKLKQKFVPSNKSFPQKMTQLNKKQSNSHLNINNSNKSDNYSNISAQLNMSMNKKEDILYNTSNIINDDYTATSSKSMINLNINFSTNSSGAPVDDAFVTNNNILSKDEMEELNGNIRMDRKNIYNKMMFHSSSMDDINIPSSPNIPPPQVLPPPPPKPSTPTPSIPNSQNHKTSNTNISIKSQNNLSNFLGRSLNTEDNNLSPLLTDEEIAKISNMIDSISIKENSTNGKNVTNPNNKTQNNSASDGNMKNVGNGYRNNTAADFPLPPGKSSNFNKVTSMKKLKHGKSYDNIMINSKYSKSYDSLVSGSGSGGVKNKKSSTNNIMTNSNSSSGEKINQMRYADSPQNMPASTVKPLAMKQSSSSIPQGNPPYHLY